jgi:uncharacterized protein YceH (UPF0502 family)
MVHLDSTESRVLGVLVEKAHTSSGYPLSLNAATDGCNQKSNRYPVVHFDEDRVMLALDRLRAKGLVFFADSLGSRVTKFRHNAREAMGVDDAELVILTELLLRGPQTAAELRMRASRMQPLESQEVVQAALGRLLERPEPMVQRIPTPRADRYAQLLCPGLHSIEAVPAAEAPLPGAEGEPPAPDRLALLEAQVLELRQIVERLAAALGATDILKPPDNNAGGAA